MRTATTSGMGPNIVLYRSLRDMLAAYPAHGVKAAIVRRKTVDLVWAPDKTVVEIHQSVMEYYEAYDRAVAQPHDNADVTMVVPVQDWSSRFTKMQGMFPPRASPHRNLYYTYGRIHRLLPQINPKRSKMEFRRPIGRISERNTKPTAINIYFKFPTTAAVF